MSASQKTILPGQVGFLTVQGEPRGGTFEGRVHVQTGELEIIHTDGKAVWVNRSRIITERNES